MAKKVYFAFAHKTVKTAVCIFAGSAIAFGLLSFFYSRNRTIEFANDYSSNLALVKNAGAFGTETDYRDALKTPFLNRKRQLVVKAHQVARKQNLLNLGSISPGETIKFLDTLASYEPEPIVPILVSDPKYDDQVRELGLVISRSLEAFDSINDQSIISFGQRRAILTGLAEISNGLDCQGTLAGNITRVNTNRDILAKAEEFQKSSAPSEQKEMLVEDCLKELSKPFDLALMLRTEHLRIQESIAIQEGDQSTSDKALGLRIPKPMNLQLKMQTKLPGVSAACKSRLNEEFAIAIQQLKDQSKSRKSNSFILGNLWQKQLLDLGSTDYLHHFGINFAAYCDSFGRQATLLFRLAHPKAPRPQTGAIPAPNGLVGLG